MRSAIGGLYAWRAASAKDQDERQRMSAEADFAYRQAFAICPISPEAVFRYTTLLVTNERPGDAVHLAGAAYKLDPDNQQLQNLVQELLRVNQQSRKPPSAK